MGGLIAYEIAQQLVRSGRRVAMLGILDSAPIGVVPWGLYALSMRRYLSDRWRFHFLRWWGLPLRERFNYFRGRWKALCYWLSVNSTKAPVITAPPPKENPAQSVPGFNDYYVAVAAAYRMRPYQGSADVFLCDAGNSKWRWYWKYMVRGGAAFHHVKGGHLETNTSPEHVAGLAKALAKALKRGEEKERAT